MSAQIFFLLLTCVGLVASQYVSWIAPEGSLLTVLVPIDSSKCRGEGGAGLADAYFVDFDEIDEITYDAFERVTGITLKAGHTWTKYGFQENTASFNQAKNLNGTNLSWQQIVTLLFTNNDYEARLACQKLDKVCSLVGLVVDNQDELRVSGIAPRKNKDTGAIIGTRNLKMKTGPGSVNTNADPTSEENIRNVTFQANAPVEAPYSTIDVAGLALT